MNRIGKTLLFLVVVLAVPAAAQQPDDEPVSSWDGVFTEAQAKRGQVAYTGPCGWCHGRRLNGAPDDPDAAPSPPLARAKFLRNWYGKSLAALFVYTKATMPESNPGSLTDQEYIDIIAYMLSVSGMPTGEHELPPDPMELARTLIQPKPVESK
ncbi:MAG: cytochrome c [Woeseiaceae bacterium]|nr:cytochrome c [Woeseiaceae bacterium]